MRNISINKLPILKKHNLTCYYFNSINIEIQLHLILHIIALTLMIY